MTEKRDDRRRFSRVAFQAPGEISQGLQRTPVEIVDLSLRGALTRVFSVRDYDLQRPLQLTISLAENVGIDMLVECVHRTDRTLGFACQSIDDVSIGHLRRLIELNLGDAQAADRELAELFDDPQ